MENCSADVTATASEDSVELFDLDSVEERLRLQLVPSAIGTFAQTAIVDVVLNRRDPQIEAEPFDGSVAKFEHFREVVARVDVQYREGDLARPESLGCEVQHHDRVFAAREQQPRAIEFTDHFTNDVDRFGLEPTQVAEFGAFVYEGKIGRAHV